MFVYTARPTKSAKGIICVRRLARCADDTLRVQWTLDDMICAKTMVLYEDNGSVRMDDYAAIFYC